jgi:2Fe-2S ferredoxin
MPRLLVTKRSGETCPLDGPAGLSVMETVREAGISEMLALCGGACSCATCHVFVDPAFAEKLPPMTPDEDGLLEGSSHRKPSSRLGCQIRMTEALSGLHVTIAPED